DDEQHDRDRHGYDQDGLDGAGALIVRGEARSTSHADSVSSITSAGAVCVTVTGNASPGMSSTAVPEMVTVALSPSRTAVTSKSFSPPPRSATASTATAAASSGVPSTARRAVTASPAAAWAV